MLISCKQKSTINLRESTTPNREPALVLPLGRRPSEDVKILSVTSAQTKRLLPPWQALGTLLFPLKSRAQHSWVSIFGLGAVLHPIPTSDDVACPACPLQSTAPVPVFELTSGSASLHEAGSQPGGVTCVGLNWPRKDLPTTTLVYKNITPIHLRE